MMRKSTGAPTACMDTMRLGCFATQTPLLAVYAGLIARGEPKPNGGQRDGTKDPQEGAMPNGVSLLKVETHTYKKTLRSKYDMGRLQRNPVSKQDNDTKRMPAELKWGGLPRLDALQRPINGKPERLACRRTASRARNP